MFQISNLDYFLADSKNNLTRSQLLVKPHPIPHTKCNTDIFLSNDAVFIDNKKVEFFR